MPERLSVQFALKIVDVARRRKSQAKREKEIRQRIAGRVHQVVRDRRRCAWNKHVGLLRRSLLLGSKKELCGVPQRARSQCPQHTPAIVSSVAGTWKVHVQASFCSNNPETKDSSLVTEQPVRGTLVGGGRRTRLH